MNKVIPAFICVAFILMLTGCKKKKFNDAIYDTIGQKIEMDIHKQDPTQFTILRYIDNPPCCLLYTSPSPRDTERSRMPSSA